MAQTGKAKRRSYPDVTAPEVELPPGWLERISQSDDPLRILLIGNVANYAYVTAKLLRRHGIDAVVIDPDFFHIMASPEWHEARLRGRHGDDYLPRWSKMSRSGYKRPDWFIQGPWQTAFRALEARMLGSASDFSTRKRINEFARRLTTGDLPWLVRGLVQGQNRYLKAIRVRALRATGMARFVDKPDGQTGSGPVRETEPADLESATQTPGITGEMNPSDATPADVPAEIEFVRQNRAFFEPILESFDLVLGFTTMSYFPAALGFKRFASVELGTIRGLPFEDSPMGRLTRYVYEQSPQTLVTNTDCLPAARKMKLEPARVHPVLHPFSVRDIRPPARRVLPSRQTRPYFLAPARHHWKVGNASILKGNDVYLRAAARLLERRANFDLRLVRWGAELDETEALIEELGLGANVTWQQPLARKRLWPVYTEAIAVLDQFGCKAFGGVSLEAMGVGQRVITRFDWPSASKFFRTPPPVLAADTVEGVETQMEACLADPDDLEGLGRRARAWIEYEHGEARQLELLFHAIGPLLPERFDLDGMSVGESLRGPLALPLAAKTL